MLHNPIVFVHGAGDSARIWRSQIERLETSHQVFAIDLPGHGQRADTLPVQASIEEYAHSVYAIIRDELRLSRPLIVGHSLGGAIALTLALAYGPQLGGLILIAAGARIRVHPALLEAARTRPAQARLLLADPSIAQVSGARPAGEQAQLAPSILYRDLMACHTFDCMGRLHEISLPSLILCGADDTATPVKYSRFLHEHISASSLSIIAGAGHYVLREQAGAVNAAIEEWLRTQ
jgi:pimeloyl-ACP methyl ester carboxylesterase